VVFSLFLWQALVTGIGDLYSLYRPADLITIPPATYSLIIRSTSSASPRIEPKLTLQTRSSGFQRPPAAFNLTRNYLFIISSLSRTWPRTDHSRDRTQKSRPIRHKLIEAALPYLTWHHIAATIKPSWCAIKPFHSIYQRNCCHRIINEILLHVRANRVNNSRMV